MNHRKKSTRPVTSGPVANGQSAAQPAASVTSNHTEATLSRVVRYVTSENYNKALDLLRNAGSNPQLRNALGVCLLRLERYEDATRILRELVLSPGCTWVRPEMPTIYKVNFATALLLDGHPAGCQEVLADTRDPSHPSVIRLQHALKQWENQLPLLKRWMWRLGSIEPNAAPAKLEFPAGEFDIAELATSGETSSTTEPTSCTADPLKNL